MNYPEIIAEIIVNHLEGQSDLSIPDITNFLERTDFTYVQGQISRNFSSSLSPVAPAHFIVDKNGIIRDILIGAPRNTEEIYDRLVSVIEKNKK